MSFLVLLSLLAGCERPGRAPEPDDLEVKVELGIEGTWNPSCWTELRIEIANRGRDLRGRVLVRGIHFTGDGDAVVYSGPLHLPASARRRFVVPVHPRLEWDAVDVTVDAPGFSHRYRSHLASPHVDVSKWRYILGIGERLRHLGGIAQEMQSVLERARTYAIARRRLEGRDTEGTPAPITCHPLVVKPSALPGRAEAYETFQLVVLYESSLVGAEPDAVEALARWVEGGGTLIAFPGPQWASSLPERLGKLLGLRAVDPDAPLPEGLSDALGADVSLGVYRRLVSAGDAEILEDGLVLWNRPGAGLTVTFSFTPDARAVAREGGFPVFSPWLARVFVRTDSFVGKAPRHLSEIEELMAALLSGMTGYRFPPAGTIFVALCLYLALGFFIPARIFKKLHRPEWTFAVIAALSCLSTYGIYRYGLLSAVERAEIEELSVLRLHGDGRGARVTSFVGCISPSFRRVDLDVPRSEKGDAAGDRLVHPLWPDIEETGVTAGRARRDSSFASVTLESARDGGLRLPPLRLYPNAPRFFRFDYSLDENGFVELRSPTGADGERRTLLKNLGSEELRTLYVAHDRALSGPTLRPGAEADVTWLLAGSPEGGEPQDHWRWIADIILEQGQLGRLQRGRHGDHAWSVQARALGLAAVAYGLEEIPSLLEHLGNRGRRAVGSDPAPPSPGHRPRYLVAWSEAQTFPGGAEISQRKKLSLAVFEYPHSGAQ